ncbi:MAG: zinc-ribbon domain-containing protein [Eubacteriales bacterium]|nr:zinc-ribbon domain-containing protein [Eubacteriales bacterium]
MKYCTKCGASNEDQARFCANCGQTMPEAAAPSVEPVIEPIVEQPQAQEYIPSQEASTPVREDVSAGQTGSYAGPVYTAPQPPVSGPVDSTAADKGSNPATLWLILNIVSTVLCCCTNIVSIIGIVFAALGMTAFNKGDAADCESKTKIAKIMFFVSLGFGVLSLIIGLASGIISSLSEYGSFY